MPSGQFTGGQAPFRESKISRRDAARIARTTRFGEGFSREGVNVTPTGNVGRMLSTDEPTWPVQVTDYAVQAGSGSGGSGSGGSGGDAEEVGLYPGLLYIPDPTQPGNFRENQCWVTTIPGFTLFPGDAGNAKLVGRTDGDDIYPPLPIYCLTMNLRNGCPGDGNDPEIVVELVNQGNELLMTTAMISEYVDGSGITRTCLYNQKQVSLGCLSACIGGSGSGGSGGFVCASCNGATISQTLYAKWVSGCLDMSPVWWGYPSNVITLTDPLSQGFWTGGVSLPGSVAGQVNPSFGMTLQCLVGFGNNPFAGNLQIANSGCGFGGDNSGGWDFNTQGTQLGPGIDATYEVISCSNPLCIKVSINSINYPLGCECENGVAGNAITVWYITDDPTFSCVPGGGSGGGGSISRASLGTAASRGLFGNLGGSQSFQSGSITTTTGDELLVIVAIADVTRSGSLPSSITPSFTGGGVTLAKLSGGSTNNPADGIFIFGGKVSTGGTGNVKLTATNLTCYGLMAVVEVSGLTDFAVDQSAQNNGNASLPNAFLTTTIADEYVQAVVAQSDSNGDFNLGTWFTPMTGGQHISQTIGALNNATFSLYESFDVLSATANVRARQTGTGTGSAQFWVESMVSLS